LSYYFWPVDESTYIKGEAIKMTQQKFKGNNISSMNIMKLKFNTALQYEIEVIIQQTYFFFELCILIDPAQPADTCSKSTCIKTNGEYTSTGTHKGVFI
jgi:hypothetical protein